ncbi:MAG: hypothetical protein HOJ34_08945 [Kordiimonadaceae bacterium]|nr:hypothetical protein [Kordiimonadaceae bacterium]MBT6036124.1 hypothetical protein [Kordiimonadaceae bacterium]MBT6329895.1 hypothetical protein [Kordiimonadaceae bacterium]
MIKKIMTFKKIAIGASMLLGLMITPNIVQAQAAVEPWTGTIAGSNIDLSSGRALVGIRSMINKGETENAVRASQRYVNELTSETRSGRTNNILYDAYNALCISLTANSEYEDALEACNNAIDHTPSRWLALNSRGTLNYKTGKYSDALTDYRSALENAPNQVSATRVIEHNIRISEARISGN